jgi:uncharacterized membrane protein
MNQENEIKDEIRKEFQLDRIVLFSDAVFAIVITLMAIEIRLPHNSEGNISTQLANLLPVIFAYAVSFAFIGHLWYQHLHFFGLLKDYDRGLIVRNLLMLFLIGFFPFSATLIASTHQSFLSILIYWTVLFSCKLAQLNIQHYILVKRPALLVSSGISQELVRFRNTRIAMTVFFIASVLVAVTMQLIPNPEQKPWAWWWFTPMPFVLNYFQKKTGNGGRKKASALPGFQKSNEKKILKRSTEKTEQSTSSIND